jgi:hypothetical protein
LPIIDAIMEKTELPLHALFSDSQGKTQRRT